MTDNEKIAGWAGWKPPENPNWHPEGLEFHFESGEDPWYDTKLQRDLGKGDRIPAAEVYRALYWSSPVGEASNRIPCFDTDIALWHGKHGLLEEIEARGLSRLFMRKLTHEVNEIGIAMAIGIGSNMTIGKIWDQLWYLVNHEANQLASALAKIIEEGNNENDQKNP